MTDHISWKKMPVFSTCLLLMTLGILALTACTGRPTVTQRVEANQLKESLSFSLSSMASVLITAETDAPVNGIEDVRIFPASIVADPSDSLELSAVALDTRGQRMTDVDFVWAMVDPRAGSITGEGILTSGLIPGVYEDAVSVTSIQNTREGISYVSQRATINVVGQVVATKLKSIAILPNKPTVLSGQIYRMRAVGFDQNGLVIPGVSFAWQVNTSGLGHVNDLGFLTVEAKDGSYPNAVTVTGVWDGERIAISTDVEVVPTPEDDDFLNVQILPKSFQLDQGASLQLRAIVLNGLGQIENSAEIRWSIEDPRAGTIGNSGVFFAGSDAGIYTESIKVEAVVFGQNGIARSEDYASVVVREEARIRRLESVRVMPQSIVSQGNGRVLLTTQGIDEQGKPLSDVTVSWEATHESVGTIVDEGRFIASNMPGNYPESLRVTLKQPLEDEIVTKSKSVDVTITGTLSKVEIRPSLATITPGRTVHFTAKGFDENGNPLAGLLTKWSVLNEDIGEIDAFGNFTAGTMAGMYEGAIQAEVIQRQPRQR